MRFSLAALALCGCAATAPARVEPRSAAIAERNHPPPVDEDRERRIEAFLAPGRGEVAAPGTLPPGLDTPLPKERAARLARCDAAISTVESKAAKTKARDPRCRELETLRDIRQLDTLRDVAVQQRIATLADAISRSAATCKSGPANPTRPKTPPTCASLAPFRWDETGWSCVADRMTEEHRAELNVEGVVWSFSIHEDLATYEVIASSCYHVGDVEEARTELVIRGRLGEKPKATQFFRRASMSD